MTQFYVTNVILSESKVFTGKEVREKILKRLREIGYDDAYVNSYAVHKMISDTLALFTENDILGCFNDKYTPRQPNTKSAYAG